MKLLPLLLALLISAFSIPQEEAVTKKSEHYLNEAANSFNKQHYVKALRASKRALSISFSENDEYHLALLYNSIGAIYNEFSQTERAFLGFYRKGLSYANKVNNDTLRLWINSNIGNVYYYNNLDVNEGIRYYEKALKLAEKTRDSLQITFIRLNIANAFFEIDKMDEGVAFIEPLSKYIEKEKKAESKITYFSLHAKYHSVKGNNKQADFLFLKAIYLAEKNNVASLLYDIYINTALHFESVNKAEEGKKYRNLAKQFEIDLQSEEKIENIEELVTQIELDEYKFQFERIEMKNELQNQKIRGQLLILRLNLII